MIITNVSTQTVEIGDLKSQVGVIGTVIAPGTSVTVFDVDAQKSAGLNALLTAGVVTITGFDEPAETTAPGWIDFEGIANWIISRDKTLQWLDHTGAVATTDAGAYAAVASARTVQLEVVDNDGILDTFNSTSTALITVTGTATGVSLNGVAYTAPVTLTLANGKASVLLASTDSGSKTVILTITSCVPTGLTHSAVMTYSFS